MKANGQQAHPCNAQMFSKRGEKSLCRNLARVALQYQLQFGRLFETDLLYK
jgi:hypothetical protein